MPSAKLWERRVRVVAHVVKERGPVSNKELIDHLAAENKEPAEAALLAGAGVAGEQGSLGWATGEGDAKKTRGNIETFLTSCYNTSTSTSKAFTALRGTHRVHRVKKGRDITWEKIPGGDAEEVAGGDEEDPGGDAGGGGGGGGGASASASAPTTPTTPAHGVDQAPATAPSKRRGKGIIGVGASVLFMGSMYQAGKTMRPTFYKVERYDEATQQYELKGAGGRNGWAARADVERAPKPSAAGASAAAAGGGAGAEAPGLSDMEQNAADIRNRVQEMIVPYTETRKVCGCEKALEALGDAVREFKFQAAMRSPNPPHSAKPAFPASGVLLHGPPGTGKTTVAKAAMKMFGRGVIFYILDAAAANDMFVGQTEKIVKELFKQARGGDTPATILIDEVDGLGASRSDQREAHASAACRAIQTCMDAADGQRVLVICATNEPWKVDTAIRRRMAKTIHVGLPDAQTRAEIFEEGLAYVSLDTRGAIDFGALAAATEGFSGSDITTKVISQAFHDAQRGASRLGKYANCDRSGRLTRGGKYRTSHARGKEMSDDAVTQEAENGGKKLVFTTTQGGLMQAIEAASRSKACVEDVEKHRKWAEGQQQS